MQVNYLSIAKKHAFDMPNFSFRLYNNIIIPNWVDFDLSPGPKRGVVEAYFIILNKVSMKCE